MGTRDSGRQHARTGDRRDRTLPVTEEVGSEGGSYADPTSQVATFGDHDAPPLVDRGGTPSTTGEALDRAAVAEHGVGAAPGPASGMVRYPTEPPSPPPAREGRKTAPGWKSALAAAGAGAAAAALLLRRGRR